MTSNNSYPYNSNDYLSTIKFKSVDILLVYAVIATSTIPFFKTSIGVGLLFICFALLYKQLINSIKIEAILFLIIVFVLEMYHYFYFKEYEGWVVWHVILYFSSAIFAIYYLKLKFLLIYMKILEKITLISFFFFFGLLVVPDLIKSFADAMPSFFRQTLHIYQDDYLVINPIIYTFDHNFYKIRNNGPFWEPTVFASLLLIAQIFNLLVSKNLFNKHGKIFTLGIITTFSTTVFISYFILLIFYFMLNKSFPKLYKISFLVIGVLVGSYLFSNLPFLEEKINTEFLNIDDNMETRGDSRMASALLDLNEVSKEDIYLFLGKGSSKYSRIEGMDKDVLRNCGLTALLVQWGIPFFILYIGLIYYSFFHLARHFMINTTFAIPFTLLIMVVSFSEIFFSLPLFHTLLFFGFVINRYSVRRKLNLPTDVAQHVVINPEMSIHYSMN